MFYNINKRQRENAREYETPSKAGCDRLKTVLLTDKSSSASRIHNVIKSDFYCMILNYLDVEPHNIKVDITCDSEGYYILKVEAVAKRILNLNFPPLE